MYLKQYLLSLKLHVSDFELSIHFSGINREEERMARIGYHYICLPDHRSNTFLLLIIHLHISLSTKSSVGKF